jgi:hypothetical protein
MVPGGLLEQQYRPVRAGLHADGPDSHLVHGTPPSPRLGVASACLTRAGAGAGRYHSTLDTRTSAITWRRHDARVPRDCEPRWPTTRAVYRF